MNCQDVIANMGFRCRDLGDGTLRILSPFTFANDGEHIGLYVEEIPTGYRITDACESLMHASAMGASITLNRLNALRKSIGYSVDISVDGEISAFTHKEGLSAALAAVLNGSLAASHLEPHWLPRHRSESFVESVSSLLERSLGERVLRGVEVKGASGHQLEIPLAVRLSEELVYVQPVATTEENTVDWKNVYASYGRMTDLKNAGIEGTSRLIVMEDASNDDQFKFALRILTEASSVVTYSKLPAWVEKRAA